MVYVVYTTAQQEDAQRSFLIADVFSNNRRTISVLSCGTYLLLLLLLFAFCPGLLLLRGFLLVPHCLLLASALGPLLLCLPERLVLFPGNPRSLDGRQNVRIGVGVQTLRTTLSGEKLNAKRRAFVLKRLVFARLFSL